MQMIPVFCVSALHQQECIRRVVGSNLVHPDTDSGSRFGVSLQFQ